MSKSLGNVVETNELLDKTSADLCRFYMMRKCSPIDFMNFDLQELNRRTYQVLSTLYHLSRFFLQNAEFDKFNPKNTLSNGLPKLRQAQSLTSGCSRSCRKELKITPKNWNDASSMRPLPYSTILLLKP